MPHELVDVTASIRIREMGDRFEAYVCTPTAKPFCVATLTLSSPHSGIDLWREDFRTVAREIADELMIAQGFKPTWVSGRNVPTGG